MPEPVAAQPVPASEQPVRSEPPGPLSPEEVAKYVEIVADLVPIVSRAIRFASSSLSVTGVLLVLGSLFIQLAPGLQLTDTDYAVTVIIGGLFALSGPLITAFGRVKEVETKEKLFDTVTARAAATRKQYPNDPSP
jgi:hypothetical protein